MESRPARPTRLRSLASRNRSEILRASAAASLAGTRKPVSPSSIHLSFSPVLLTTTGTPQAIASAVLAAMPASDSEVET